MSFQNTYSKLKKYFWFTKEELTQYLLLTLVLAFIYSFKQWGEITFSVSAGIWNLIIAIILVGTTIFVHHAGQRISGIKKGFKVEQKNSWYLILFGLVLCFLTNGNIRFLAGSGTHITHLPQHRIGAFRYGAKLSEIGRTMLAGPFYNVLFALIIAGLGWALIIPPETAQAIFSLNLWFAVCNLLPIPPLDGIHIFYWSRFAYVFIFSSITAYAILTLILPAYIFVAAIAIGAILAYLFSTKYDS